LKFRNIIITREKIEDKDIPIDRVLQSQYKTNIIMLPVIQIVPIISTEINNKIEEIKKGVYDQLLFLSANSVEIFFNIIENKSNKVEIKNKVEELSIISIGPKTKKTIEEKGLKASLVTNSSNYSLNEIINYLDLLDKEIFFSNRKKLKILVPRSLESLKSQNYINRQFHKIILDQIFIYETTEFNKVSESQEWTKFIELDKNHENYIIFTSPSSVRAFFNIITKKNLIKMTKSTNDKEMLLYKGIKKIISIGPKTSQELHSRKIEYIEAEHHTIQGALVSLFKNI